MMLQSDLKLYFHNLHIHANYFKDVTVFRPMQRKAWIARRNESEWDGS